MKQDPKKQKIGVVLSGVLQAQAITAISTDLDLWPELRRELAQRSQAHLQHKFRQCRCRNRSPPAAAVPA